jgi:hypothetical protein
LPPRNSVLKRSSSESATTFQTVPKGGPFNRATPSTTVLNSSQSSYKNALHSLFKSTTTSTPKANFAESGKENILNKAELLETNDFLYENDIYSPALKKNRVHVETGQTTSKYFGRGTTLPVPSSSCTANPVIEHPFSTSVTKSHSDSFCSSHSSSPVPSSQSTNSPCSFYSPSVNDLSFTEELTTRRTDRGNVYSAEKTEEEPKKGICEISVPVTFSPYEHHDLNQPPRPVDFQLKKTEVVPTSKNKTTIVSKKSASKLSSHPSIHQFFQNVPKPVCIILCSFQCNLRFL